MWWLLISANTYLRRMGLHWTTQSFISTENLDRNVGASLKEGFTHSRKHSREQQQVSGVPGRHTRNTFGINIYVHDSAF